MDDTAPQGSGPDSPTDAKRSWLSTVLGVDFEAVQGGGPVSPGGSGAPMSANSLAAGPKAASAATKSAPGATATDLFFEHDSPELTASDRQSLDAYAKAYLGAKSSEPVAIEAFASTEGDARHNQQLSNDRAKAVADYLIGQGVPKDKVTATGRGTTSAFSKDDLSQNRRATIKPPPPSAGSATGRSTAQPSGNVSLRMRHDTKTPLDGKGAAEKVVGPSTDVPRAQVERKLKEFLHDLAKAQKTRSVRTTDKVWTAETTLRLGLGGEPVVKRGESKDYDPDELAHKIAGQLPDAIPGANYDAFLKIKPVDIPVAGSTTDQLRKKYEEKRDEIIHKLPKAAQGLAKKGMDAAVEKGVPFVADEALKALGVDSKLEGEMKDAVDEYAKKIAGDTSGDDK